MIARIRSLAKSLAGVIARSHGSTYGRSLASPPTQLRHRGGATTSSPRYSPMNARRVTSPYASAHARRSTPAAPRGGSLAQLDRGGDGGPAPPNAVPETPPCTTTARRTSLPPTSLRQLSQPGRTRIAREADSHLRVSSRAHAFARRLRCPPSTQAKGCLLTGRRHSAYVFVSYPSSRSRWS